MTVAIVGDREKVEPALAGLGIGEPQVMEHED